ncbi:class I SAM-dependent methyltransferase [Saccharibacillus alkalitolerans]|uniref:Methyltransferase domain-containing protein n=1 Tax=Saccharibacillus alkalitolerans TaxID=2705290 RepID=A0ABX0FBI8_9BACL|nr:methyltransferase domain-containing protein [Saccharibacillus alkalitolerans]NGZ76923.1 methyltransferase domain-containing protein [Saccharibacillus alkalitolerans]
MIDISRLAPQEPIKIIIGASSQRYTGWIQTQQEQLNLLEAKDWEQSFKDRKIDAILSEHVWEHLTYEEGVQAARNCFAHLNTGGYVRCAVPDGYFPNEEYQNLVKVGGPGSPDHPAAGHQIVHNYRTLTKMFEEAGFEAELLEYCDEAGKFHFKDWDPEKGFIYRSERFDHRNRNGHLGFVSLIVDAKKG